METILRAAGAEEVITIDRYAHLVGGARMAATPAGRGRRRRPPGLRRRPTVRRRRQRAAHPGRRQPRADHHGAGRARRRPDGPPPGRSSSDAPTRPARNDVHRTPSSAVDVDAVHRSPPRDRRPTAPCSWDATTAVTVARARRRRAPAWAGPTAPRRGGRRDHRATSTRGDRAATPFDITGCWSGDAPRLPQPAAPAAWSCRPSAPSTSPCGTSRPGCSTYR